MKKIKTIFLFVFLLFLWSLPAVSQQLINAGSDIYVSPGTKMVVASDFINLNDGQIDNNGNVNLYGNWTNDASTEAIAAGGTGTTTFKGIHPQTIGGVSASHFNSLYTENDSSLYLAANVNVENKLNIISGKIHLTDYDLNLGTGEDITSGYLSSSHFIKSDGTGRLLMNVPSGTGRYFRVGATNWNFVYIENNAADDLFAVNVRPDVLTGGTTGTTIPEIDDCVPVTWNISPANTASADYSIRPEWYEYQGGVNFNQFQSAIGYYKDGQWNPNLESYAIGDGQPYLQRLENITFGASFAIGDLESPMAIPIVSSMDISAFLEGPFDGNGMSDKLNNSGLIPLSQPFNTPPWNYQGTESVTSVPPNVVDWVLLEGRDSPTAGQAGKSQIFDTKAAFLLKDGSIVGLDGVSPVNLLHFHNLNNGLFVVVHHRNHLSILSANPLTETNGVYTYDFTTATSQAYLSGEKDINGTAVMYGGDVNSDNQVNDADVASWASSAGKAGYLNTDATLDGQTDNRDKNDMSVSNNGIGTTVPD